MKKATECSQTRCTCVMNSQKCYALMRSNCSCKNCNGTPSQSRDIRHTMAGYRQSTPFTMMMTWCVVLLKRHSSIVRVPGRYVLSSIDAIPSSSPLFQVFIHSEEVRSTRCRVAPTQANPRDWRSPLHERV